MKKRLQCLLATACVLSAGGVFAAGLEEFSVTADPGVEIGPVKDMHAVNNVTNGVKVKMRPLSFALVEFN